MDVNFINPASNSFLGQPKVSAVIKNLYSTILALSVSFFGILVLITAIKLVISTIASEKAKYKKAIVDWLVGFIMLFCIHYGISFMFYLNEQLVVVASKIVSAQLETITAEAMIEASYQVQDLIDSVGNEKFSGKYKGKKNVPIKQILEENKHIVEAFITLDTSDDSVGLHELLTTQEGDWGMTDSSVLQMVQHQNLAAIISWASSNTLTEIDRADYDRHYNRCIDGGGWWSTCKLEATKNAKRIEIPFDHKYVLDIIENDIYFVQAEIDGVWGRSDDEKGSVIAEDILDEMFDILDYDPRETWLPWIDEHSATYALLNKIEEYDFDFITTMAVAAGGAGITDKDNINEILKGSPGDKATYEEYGKYELFIMSPNLWVWKDYGGDELHGTFDWISVFQDLATLKIAAEGGSSGTSSLATRNRLIPDLARYFKYYATEKEIATKYNVIGLTDSGSINIQNMLMYSILVIQSLILFIAYIKRLFYVLILAIMAPAVVVMDFFQKFGK